MTFGFTRDSALWWLLLLLPLITFVQSSDAWIADWDGKHWLQFVAYVATTAIAKLQTSPLSHSDDQK